MHACRQAQRSGSAIPKEQAHPPISYQTATCHIARHRTAQEQNHVRDLLGRRQTTHRYPRQDSLFESGQNLRCAPHHLRIHVGRADAVYTDGVGYILKSCERSVVYYISNQAWDGGLLFTTQVDTRLTCSLADTHGSVLRGDILHHIRQRLVRQQRGYVYDSSSGCTALR